MLFPTDRFGVCLSTGALFGGDMIDIIPPVIEPGSGPIGTDGWSITMEAAGMVLEAISVSWSSTDMESIPVESRRSLLEWDRECRKRVSLNY